MKLNFGHLLGLSSLLVAGCAAFFSVYGLSQLFAGASTAVIIMASGLEFSKIIAASFLHRFWGKLAKALKIYLTIGVVILVTITSAGIYGFLSNAYQMTANNLELHEGEVGVLDTKINQFQSKIDNNNKIIELKTKRLNQLSDLRSGQESRLDGRNARNARADITDSSNEIKTLNTEIDKFNGENSVLMDSISKYNVGKLDLNNKSKVVGEVGPLKYMVELTGVPMNKIVNYFILLLIFVFDPLAIALVIATNWYFEKKRLGELDETPIIKQNISLNDGLISTQPLDLATGPLYEEEIMIEPLDLTVPDNVKDFMNNHKESEGKIFDVLRIPEEYFDEKVDKIEENNLELDTPMDVPDEYEESLTGDTVTEIQDVIIETFTGNTQQELTNIIETFTEEPKERKITREDIKEIKQEERGFSVNIPKSKNTIERVSQNKWRDGRDGRYK